MQAMRAKRMDFMVASASMAKRRNVLGRIGVPPESLAGHSATCEETLPERLQIGGKWFIDHQFAACPRQYHHRTNTTQVHEEALAVDEPVGVGELMIGDLQANCLAED